MSAPDCSVVAPPAPTESMLNWFAVLGAVVVAACVFGTLYVWIIYAGRLKRQIRRRLTMRQFSEAARNVTSLGQDTEQRHLAYPHMLVFPARAPSGEERQ